MKKFNLLVVMVIVVCFFAGCAGFRSATVETDATGNISRWDDSNKSILQPSISPTEIGRANVLNSRADLNRALAVQVASGEPGAVVGNFSGIIINNDKYRTMYVRHPFIDAILDIPAGDFFSIRAPIVPKNIYICWQGENRFKRNRIFEEPVFYQGQKFDFGGRYDKNR